MGFGIAPELRKFHKLREEHVKFSPCLRMQVKIVVQVSQDFHTYDKNNIYTFKTFIVSLFQTMLKIFSATDNNALSKAQPE